MPFFNYTDTELILNNEDKDVWKVLIKTVLLILMQYS